MKNVSKHLWAKLSCGFVAVLLLLTATAPMLCGCSKNYDYSTFTYADFEALRVSYFYEKDDTQYQFVTSEEALESGNNFPSAIFLYEDGSAFFAHYSPTLVGGFSQIYTDADHYLLYPEFGTWSEDENGVLHMHFLRSPGKNEDGTYIVAEEDLTAEFVDGESNIMAQVGMYAPPEGSGGYGPMTCVKGEIVAPSFIEYFNYLEAKYYE